MTMSSTIAGSLVGKNPSVKDLEEAGGKWHMDGLWIFPDGSEGCFMRPNEQGYGWHIEWHEHPEAKIRNQTVRYKDHADPADPTPDRKPT